MTGARRRRSRPGSPRRRCWLWAAAAALLAPPTAGSADGPPVTPEPYARVMLAEGGSFVFLPSPAGRLAAERNLPVPPRSTLKTGAGGRMELDLAPIATLRLSDSTELDLERAPTGAWEAHLRHGKVHLQMWGDRSDSATVRTEFGDVIPRLRAQVSIGRATDGVVVDAREGIVEIRGGEGFATMLPAPGRIILRRGTPLLSAAGPSGAPGLLRDDFMAWVERRKEERGPEGQPRDLWDAYGRELKEHGTFVRVSGATCWAPADDLDPLREGWSLTISGDEIWIPRAAWGWSTSHYGRWLRQDGRWLWVPGTVFQSRPVRTSRLESPPTPHPFASAGAPE